MPKKTTKRKSTTSGTRTRKLDRKSDATKFSPLSNLPGTGLPSGLPASSGAWQAYEIVLIKWRLSRTATPTPSIDQDESGVYSNATLVNDPQRNDYLNNIQQFAIDVAADNVALAKDPLHLTASGTGPCDFVVWYPCYVVFVLEENYWRFQQGIGKKALSTGFSQATNTYTDLKHLLGAGVSSSVGYNSCRVAYFSSNSVPQAYSVMPFNLFFDYQPIGSLIYKPGDFDPAIKNDGHT